MREGDDSDAHDPRLAARTLCKIAHGLEGLAFGSAHSACAAALSDEWRSALITFSATGDPTELLSMRTEAVTSGNPERIGGASAAFSEAWIISVSRAVSTAPCPSLPLTAKQTATNETMAAAPKRRRVTVTCPVRLDLAGGWSDTPPITYEVGGTVVNVAVTLNGFKPVGATASLTRVGNNGGGSVSFLQRDNFGPSTETLVCNCDSEESLRDGVGNPLAPAALAKCCLLAMGIGSVAVSSGLEICSWSDVPQGSGLGTSSIVAAAICTSVSMVLFGVDLRGPELIHLVLKVEQLLSTGGGWQDQVGGVLPGFKVSHSEASLPLVVESEIVSVPSGFAEAFASHVALVYTGKQRLAKNLLRATLHNWFLRRESGIGATVKSLTGTATKAADALRNGDITALAECMSEYMDQKCAMAGPTAFPEEIASLRRAVSPYALGSCFAGAGGGGFLVVVTRQPNAVQIVRDALAGTDADPKDVYSASVDLEGMHVEVCNSETW